MRISLTLPGALSALLAAPVLVLWPGPWTLLLCALAWALLVSVDLARTPDPRRIAVRREGPGQVRLGTAAPGRLLLTNPGRRPARLHVRDAWNPTAGLAQQRTRLVVPGGERRAVAQVFAPTRRGEHASRAVVVDVLSPWGLARRSARPQAPGTLLALHAFASRRHLPSRVRRLREIEGLAAVHQRGQGTEFDSLRDFVDGDDVRSIDWRATARRRSVVVRTWRPERDRHVLVVVDTSRTSAARIGEAPRLDAALDAALLLTALATEAGDRVDVLCIDRIPHVSVAGSARRTVLHDVVAATSPVQPALVETDWERVAAEVAARTRRHALVVLITPVEPSVPEQGLLPVAARIAASHPLVVASVADPSLASLAAGRRDAEEVHRAAAASRTILEREGVARELVRCGAHVVDAGPEALPQELADEYLRLKAAGRL